MPADQPAAAMQRTYSPADGRLVCERPLLSEHQAAQVCERAHQAHLTWRQVPIKERVQLCLRMCERFMAKQADIAREIAEQMGRQVLESSFCDTLTCLLRTSLLYGFPLHI